MKYDKIVEAIFIERPNRFIARVKIDGAEEVELVHVKNTGRCRVQRAEWIHEQVKLQREAEDDPGYHAHILWGEDHGGAEAA